MARALCSVLTKMRKESWRKKWNASKGINLQCCCVQRECCIYDVMRERFDITRTWSAYGKREERSALRDIYRLYARIRYTGATARSSPRDVGEKKGNLVIKQLHLSHPSEHAVLSMRAFYLSRIKKCARCRNVRRTIFFSFFFLWSLLTRREAEEDVSGFQKSRKNINPENPLFVDFFSSPFYLF